MAGEETVLIELWLQAVLEATSAVTDIVDDRIYPDKAPDDAVYPFVVYGYQDGSDVLGVGTARLLTDTLYFVKATSRVDSYEPLKELAAALDEAVTLTGPVTVAGGFIHGALRQNPFRMVEVEEGRQVRSLGGIYKIVSQAS